MRTKWYPTGHSAGYLKVGMKPLSERDENGLRSPSRTLRFTSVGMKPLSERDENGLL